MARGSTGIEAHLLFCPPLSVEAQISTGQYIADLRPSVVWLGTRANTNHVQYGSAQTQGFYDSITGYDNPDSLGKLVEPLVGDMPVYGSAFELAAALRGRDEAIMHTLDALEEQGNDLNTTIPYYHTVMQLKDTGIGFVNWNPAPSEELLNGDVRPINNTIHHVLHAQKDMLLMPNGIEELDQAVRAYRAELRKETADMKNNVIKIIKRMPSNLPPGEKVAILTDQPGIYDIRKQQPSKKVKTVVMPFGTAKLTERQCGNKKVLEKYAFPGFIDFEAGTEFSLEKATQLGLEDSAVAWAIIGAIYDHYEIEPKSETREEAEMVTNAALVAVNDQEKAAEFLKAVKNVARKISDHDLQTRIEQDSDPELNTLKDASYVQELMRIITDTLIKLT